MDSDAPGTDALGSRDVADRRKHRRLKMSLPLECSPRGTGHEASAKGIAANVSTGGLYFEMDLANGRQGTSPRQTPELDDLLQIELTIPPGEGHFPYEGRVRSVVQILRREELSTAPDGR